MKNQERALPPDNGRNKKASEAFGGATDASGSEKTTGTFPVSHYTDVVLKYNNGAIDSTPILLQRPGKKSAVIGHIITPTNSAPLLFKKLKSSKHRLRIPPAWACDLIVIEQATRLDCLDFVILDTDTNKIWVAPFTTWAERGFNLDRGHGKQRALTVENWQVIPPTGANTAPSPAAPKPTPQPQMSLFDGSHGRGAYV